MISKLASKGLQAAAQRDESSWRETRRDHERDLATIQSARASSCFKQGFISIDDGQCEHWNGLICKEFSMTVYGSRSAGILCVPSRPSGDCRSPKFPIGLLAAHGRPERSAPRPALPPERGAAAAPRAPSAAYAGSNSAPRTGTIDIIQSKKDLTNI